MNRSEQTPYQSGRNVFSASARIFNLHTSNADVAHDLIGESYGCIDNIAERSGYGHIKEFYNFHTKIDREALEPLLLDYKMWSKLTINDEKAYEDFKSKCLNFPISVIRAVLKKHKKAKVKSLEPMVFLEDCAINLFDKFRKDVPNDSLWTTDRPVLDVKPNKHCPHHPDKSYCFYVRKIRSWDYMLDPTDPYDYQLMVEQEDDLNKEFENLMKELRNG